jgi:pimeloyl-ACP methyl ester carboxylesterase
MRYHRAGEGEPLLLVHGIGSRWQVWSPIIDALAENRDVIAVDLPGFGLSPDRPGIPTVNEQALRLAELLDVLGIDQPHVAGSSMGGGIALELGRMGMASTVTAFSPIGFWSDRELAWTRMVLRGAHGFASRAPFLAQHLVRSRVGRTAALGMLYGKPWLVGREAARLDVDGLAGSAAFTAALDAFERFPQDDLGELLFTPATVAWGSRDVLLRYRTHSRRARLALPGARHVTLHGAGHLPFSDTPAICARLMLDASSATPPTSVRAVLR